MFTVLIDSVTGNYFKLFHFCLIKCIFHIVSLLIRAFSDFKAFLYILIGGFSFSDFKAFLYILIGGFS